MESGERHKKFKKAKVNAFSEEILTENDFFTRLNSQNDLCRVDEEALKEDPVVDKLYESSEEGKKVSRNQGGKNYW